MKELQEYRDRLITRYKEAGVEFSAACGQAPTAYAPVEGSEWNVHQIAVHVRDVHEHVYAYRARRTVEEANPLLENFNGDAWMAEHYNEGEALGMMMDWFTAKLSSFTDWLHDLPPEAWSRVSRHETLGSGFTTQTWVERGLAHIEEHLASVQKTSLKT